MGSDLTVREAGVTTRDEFGAIEVQRGAEVSQIAASARETAAINARYIMAMNRPRDIERFRVSLLKECKRPGFAEEAEYERPVGKEKDENGNLVQKIARGPSIRLMEAAAARYGNLLIQAPVTFENDEQRVVSAFIVDLESNVSWERSIVIAKRIEKRGYENRKTKKIEPPQGRTVISQRVNSYGDTTFLVEATDDEIAVRQSAMESKAQRKNLERLIPRDIIDEAIAVANETIKAGIKADPEEARRKLIDAFASLNVMPDDLAGYLGKKLEQSQPAEIQKLRKIYKALADGEATWQEIMDHATGPEGGSREDLGRVAQERIATLRRESEAKTQQSSDNPPEEKKRLNRREELELWMENAPESISVLEANGYKTVDHVPESKLPDILKAVSEAARASGPTVRSGLNLGGKK